MIVNMKKIISILRSEGMRVLEPEKSMSLCDILKASIAFGFRPPSNHVNDRLVCTLPEGYTYRKQMWAHFKGCASCMGQLRSLYRQRKTIDITVLSEANSMDRKGVLKVEIKLKPFEFKTNAEEVASRAI